jgi:hypothetical protein
VYHMARLTPGCHQYGGWYHFVGVLETHGDFAAVTYGDGFSCSMLKASAPRLSTLDGLPAVELEFTAELVPWGLREPEPE